MKNALTASLKEVILYFKEKIYRTFLHMLDSLCSKHSLVGDF
jgi:hypothetical protein